MSTSGAFVERIRPLLADCTLAEQLFVVVLLESRSADRYREWAGQVSEPAVARGLQACADREDEIASRIRSKFDGVLRQPAGFDKLAQRIQAEVVAIFGGHSREEQFGIQAEAERGGEQLWIDLAVNEADETTKRLLLECASLEAGSAEFLESLAR